MTLWSAKEAIACAASVLVIAVLLIGLTAIGMFVGRAVGNVWHAVRLTIAWPPQKFVLLAYTQSHLWAPYIERELLPTIAEHCIVVDRSRDDWKHRFRVECKALSFWGGRRSYNPIAIVVRPWYRVQVFRFYEAFKDLKHGEPAALERKTRELVQYIRGTAEGLNRV